MKLADNLRNGFLPKIRSRGQEYFNRGRVTLFETEPDNIKAGVSGSNDYEVKINFTPTKTGISCTCPYYTDWDSPCKHLWATILELDSMGYKPFSIFNNREGERGKKPYAASYGPDSWQSRIQQISKDQKAVHLFESKPTLPFCFFTVKIDQSLQQEKLAIKLELRYRKKDGLPGRQEKISLAKEFLEHGNSIEQQIFTIFFAYQESYTFYSEGPKDFYFPISAAEMILPLLETYNGTKVLSEKNSKEWPLTVDKGKNWQFVILLKEDKDDFVMYPVLKRDNLEIPLEAAGVIFRGPPMLFFHQGTFSRLEGDFSFAWILFFRKHDKHCRIPGKDIDRFYKELGNSIGKIPKIIWPEDFWKESFHGSRPVPVLQLKFKANDVSGELRFEYRDGQNKQTVDAFNTVNPIIVFEKRLRIFRDRDFENNIIETLNSLPDIKFAKEKNNWLFHQDRLTDVIHQMIDAGIEVLAEDKKKITGMSNFNITVTSGIDWFDMTGKLTFDDSDISIIEMMESLQRGERFVRLSNGGVGILPEKWLERNKWILELGQKNCGKASLKFSKAHAGVIQTLSGDEQYPVKFDLGSRSFFKKLKAFSGIKRVPVPKSLTGKLRDYQNAGFEWLAFLNEFGFGGILADDMGLGKTVQILTMLLHTKSNNNKKTSLVVVPASLVFNWEDEVNKFAPSLKIINYTGLQRNEILKKRDGDEIILTTYGILRRDFEKLSAIDFLYVILDEAQAMKNANSSTARVVRTLKADHRIALSGTPVENHLGELWSIMAFLNPGLLWKKEQFYSRYCRKTEITEGDLNKLKRLVNPFILRRKKEEVLKELPPKTEQTVYCEMAPHQRKIYNEVRDYYRLKLLRHIDSKGMNKSKIVVLEGLLRLRQTACHPALIKPQTRVKSAKLNELMNMVYEVMEEGHKALIFSQFTTMLAIIEKEVKKQGISYAYLDGSTRNRKEVVKKFQENTSCRLFLISLKAGGLGLNLTAASYVFIFDPWWNPAVEMQAVDRAHRIGQEQKVTAYRLITRDSVEEKIMELQKRKKELAGSIISSEGSLIKKISRKDIEYLFG